MARPARRANVAGFAMVELLAVLGVTIVMGALAVSAYRTYAVRAQIAASVMGAAAIQQRVARAFKRDGTPPPDLEAAGLAADLAEAAAEFVESVRSWTGGSSCASAAARTRPSWAASCR